MSDELLKSLIDQLEWVEIDLLRPDEKNPKEHTEEDLKKIEGSIKRFGFVLPVVADRETQVILDGHGRYFVLKKLIDKGKWPYGRKIPVLWVKTENEEERRKILVALQYIKTEVDPIKLSELLSLLNPSVSDLESMGLSPQDLTLLTPPTPTDFDLSIPFDISPIPLTPPSEPKPDRPKNRLSISFSSPDLKEELVETLKNLSVPKDQWGDFLSLLVTHSDPNVLQSVKDLVENLNKGGTEIDPLQNPFDG